MTTRKNPMEYTTPTPGPWRVSPTTSQAIVSDGETGHDDEGNVAAYGGHLIAESIFHNANRRLICAAPDLLAACEDALEESNVHDFDRGVVARLLAAIQKAKGQ